MANNLTDYNWLYITGKKEVYIRKVLCTLYSFEVTKTESKSIFILVQS